MAVDGIHTAAVKTILIFCFQSIMAQYSDEQQRKEFLDSLFTYLENEGMCVCFLGTHRRRRAGNYFVWVMKICPRIFESDILIIFSK